MQPQRAMLAGRKSKRGLQKQALGIGQAGQLLEGQWGGRQVVFAAPLAAPKKPAKKHANLQPSNCTALI
jgi:hypothetical protein